MTKHGRAIKPKNRENERRQEKEEEKWFHRNNKHNRSVGSEDMTEEQQAKLRGKSGKKFLLCEQRVQ